LKVQGRGSQTGKGNPIIPLNGEDGARRPGRPRLLEYTGGISEKSYAESKLRRYSEFLAELSSVLLSNVWIY
jgi:hypothetical protein